MAALDRDESEWIASALRTARRWGRPPCTVLAQRPENWREEDTLLAMALDQFEATRLDRWGFPKRHTEDGDNEGHFEVATRFNAAEQAKVLWDKDEGAHLEAGLVPYIIDTRYSVGPSGG